MRHLQLFPDFGNAFLFTLERKAAGSGGHFQSVCFCQEIQNLLEGADFRDVSVQEDTRSLCLPAPEEFLWQYVQSTPLAGALKQMNDEVRASLERDVVDGWQQFVKDQALILEVRMVIAAGRK